MRTALVRGGVILLGGLLLWALLGALSGYGHDPNHDIDREKARAAANRVHVPPKMGDHPGAGG